MRKRGKMRRRRRCRKIRRTRKWGGEGRESAVPSTDSSNKAC